MGFPTCTVFLPHGHLELVRRHDAILRKRTQRTVVRGVFLYPAVVFVIASGHDVKRVGGNRAARNRLLDIRPDLPERTRLGGLRRNVGRPEGMHVDFQPLTGSLARHAEVPARPVAAAVTAGHQIGDPILVNVACRRRVDLRLLRLRKRRIGRPRFVGAPRAFEVAAVVRIGHPNRVVAARIVAIGVVAHALAARNGRGPGRVHELVGGGRFEVGGKFGPAKARTRPEVDLLAAAARREHDVVEIQSVGALRTRRRKANPQFPEQAARA